MPPRCWLVKQEPSDYSWARLVADRTTAWTGVRNFQARNHLRAMQPGDSVLFYHSGATREIVGVAQVTQAAFPDPTATEGDWSAVELKAVQTLTCPVSLATMKADPALRDLPLIRQTRLSVLPVSSAEFRHLLRLGQTQWSASHP